MTRVRPVAVAGIFLIVLALGGCGGGGGTDVTEREILIEIDPQGTEGTSGTLSLSKSGDATNVVVHVLVPSGGGRQKASFYTGACTNFDEASEIEIGPLEEGTGALTIDTPIEEILEGGYVLVVHKSFEDETVIACAPIDVE
jgi:hypothetical protein